MLSFVDAPWILFGLAAGIMLIITGLAVVAYPRSGATFMGFIALFAAVGLFAAAAVVSAKMEADPIVVSMVAFMVAALGLAHVLISAALFTIGWWQRKGGASDDVSGPVRQPRTSPAAPPAGRRVPGEPL